MRIGFLFNHDQSHQVAHSLPIALKLADMMQAGSIVLLTTNSMIESTVKNLARSAVGDRISCQRLLLRRPVSRFADAMLGRFLPVSKLAVYGDNLETLSSFDALVVSEKTSLLLKTRYGLKKPILIHTRHGAGDRAIGFDAKSALFDHVLVSGPKIRDRLIAEVGMPPDRITMVGYPKFDMSAPDLKLKFAGNGRPTVIYNPHPSPHLSSWYKFGREVLEYFRTSEKYNLIFAPHVMLFHRPLVVSIDKLRFDRAGQLDSRLNQAPHIHVDLGSENSTNMTYTNAADIYLGDVSSQVYEFLVNPRPCIFVDAHATQYQGDKNYAHWQAGRVVSNIRELDVALSNAVSSQPNYLATQRQLLAATFDLGTEKSSTRAARAILRIVDGESK
jgi:CDP-Glycerol:Poly(glycerophosphate) glycerophosphotransferase